ncbi:MAG: hypothetical protein J7513_13900 [Solirubrobacteraceae bacterium]|nr:hypothetical protein [Solirubrobacteraceae bacterium]
MLAAVVARYRRLVKLGWPRSYPLVQFPNAPLLVALGASVVGWFVSGDAQDYATAVGTVGIAVWAWQEAVDGDNGFRHALGVGGLIYTVITLAGRLG